MSPEQIAARLQEFEALCRRRGISLTVQRRLVLETVLEGRHGVRLAELQGRSFYGGPAPGVAADREPASGAQAAVTAILDEVDRLWRRRQALARLIWRMDLAAGGESGAARLVSPRGLAERVPLPAWDSR